MAWEKLGFEAMSSNVEHARVLDRARQGKARQARRGRAMPGKQDRARQGKARPQSVRSVPERARCSNVTLYTEPEVSLPTEIPGRETPAPMIRQGQEDHGRAHHGRPNGKVR